MLKRLLFVAAIVLAPFAYAAPAQAAGECWVTAYAPHMIYMANGYDYLIASGSNHCAPPATVSSMRMEIQKRKCFVWCYWSTIHRGSTVYAKPGQLDMDSSVVARFAGSGKYRTLVNGTANADRPYGADYSSEVSIR